MNCTLLLDTFDVVALINGYTSNQAFFKELKEKGVSFCLSRGSSFELSNQHYANSAGLIRLIHTDLDITDLSPSWDLFLKNKEEKEIFSNNFLHRALPSLWVNIKKEDFFENYFKKTFLDMDPALEKHYYAILERDNLDLPFKLKGLNKETYKKYCKALSEAFAKDVEIRDKNITLPKIAISLSNGHSPNRDSSGITYVTSYSSKNSGITIKEFNKLYGTFAYVRYCVGIHLSMINSKETIIPTRLLRGTQCAPISKEVHYKDFDSDLKSRLISLYSIKMQIQKNVLCSDRNTQVDGTRLMHLPDVSLMSADKKVYDAIRSCEILPEELSSKIMPKGYVWCQLIKKYGIPEGRWPTFLDKEVIATYLASGLMTKKSAYLNDVTRLHHLDNNLLRLE